MGEKSRKIGEIGEDIAAKFFHLIGWRNVLQDQEIVCNKPNKHRNSKGNPSKSHGIDFLFCYLNPLEANSLEHIVVSVKNTEAPYGTNPKSKFKEHAEDLMKTMECYKISALRSNQTKEFSGFRKQHDTGLLIWTTLSEESDDDVVAKVANAQMSSEYPYTHFHLLDNRQMAFVYESISFLKNHFGDKRLNFLYPETALNYEDKAKKNFGSVLPIELISAPLIPLIHKAKSSDEQDTVCLVTQERFDADTLSRLIHVLNEYTNEISCNYMLLFPDYRRDRHDNAVRSVLSGIAPDLSEKISVVSYSSDFRSL